MAASRGWFEGSRVLAVIALLLAVMTALVLAVHGTGEEGVRALIRATARSSLPLFLLAFVASSARSLWRRPLTAWLLRNRRQLGLGFAVSHAIHLVAIVSLARGWPDSFDSGVSALTRYAGGLGYVLIAAMAATSSDAAFRWLGAKRWRLLHRIGAWTVFLIFAQSYGPAVLVDPSYAPASAAIVAAAMLRFAAWWTTRARDTSSPREPARSA